MNKIEYKINCCFGCVLFIHVSCLWMCVLLYFSVVCLHMYAYDFKSKDHCGSALGPGASGLPCYCTPLVCVRDVIGGLAVWRHNKPNTKNQKQTPNPLMVKGIARIRHVGCAHPGDTPTLTRIRSSKNRCAHPSKKVKHLCASVT